MIGGELKKRRVWMLLFLFLLGACTITYTHPTKNSRDFDRDKQECEVAAKKTLAAKGVT
jgi:hypothetical protein